LPVIKAEIIQEMLTKRPMDNTDIINGVIAADIGGSHITAAVVDLDNKRVAEGTRIRAPINSRGTSDEILRAWTTVLKQVKESAAVSDRLALAMPGPFDYTNGISLIKDLHKYEAIYNTDVKAHLARHLAIEPENIVFRNDAEAFLHGEVVGGAARDCSKVAGLTLGTGMGSAKSVNGITEDLNLGSTLYLDSIADDYFSTRWFIQRYKKLSGINCSNVKEIMAFEHSNDLVKQIFNEFAENLSHFIGNYLEAEQPEILVIGGNISKAHHLFLNEIKYCLSGNT